MEQAIVNYFIKSDWGIWGILLIVLLYLVKTLLSSSTFLDLFKHSSKTNFPEISNYQNYKYKFTLLKIVQPSNKLPKILLSIIYISYILFLTYAKYLVATKKLNNTYNILIYIGVALATYSLCDLYIKNKHTLSLEFFADPENLFKAYLSMLFDMNMHIVSLDLPNLEITSFLNGNWLTIKILSPDLLLGKVEVSFTRESDFVGVIFFSSQFRNNLQTLIKNTAYPTNS